MSVCESCEYRDNPVGVCCDRAGEILEKDNRCKVSILDEMKLWHSIRLYTHRQESYLKPYSNNRSAVEFPEKLLTKAKKDLSPKQYEVLSRVITNNERAVELAKAWGVSKPAISKLKNKVEKYLEQAIRGG